MVRKVLEGEALKQEVEEIRSALNSFTSTAQSLLRRLPRKEKPKMVKQKFALNVSYECTIELIAEDSVSEPVTEAALAKSVKRYLSDAISENLEEAVFDIISFDAETVKMGKALLRVNINKVEETNSNSNQ